MINETVTNLPLKRRRPWLGWIAGILTLGIYWLVWYYNVNKELAEMGRKVNPGGMIAVFIFLGWLIFPPLVSVYNTGDRIKVTEREAGIADSERVSGGLGLLLYILGGLALVYYQSHLNRIIDAHEARGGQAT